MTKQESRSQSGAKNAPALLVGGVPFRRSNMKMAVDQLLVRLSRPSSAIEIRLANAYCVVLANQQESYGTLLSTRGINYPDGQPIAWAMRLLSRRSANRVRGPSFFVQTLKQSTDRPVRHFFLGASSETLDRLVEQVSIRFSGIDIVGAYSPPFAPITPSYLRDIIVQVESAQPSIVWVGMGTPKQDFVAAHIVDQLGVTAVGVGAAFDFLAGSIKEAPTLIQNSGFEWLYRLFQEPRRLWKRYLLGNLLFIRYACRPNLRIKSSEKSHDQRDNV